MNRQTLALIHRIAIDASTAGSGAAIRYLSRICPALAEASPETTYHLFSRASQLSRLPPLPTNFHWVEIPEATISRPLRLLWLQVALPRILKRLEVDVLLAASDVSTLRPPCPLVLFVTNFNPFSPLRGQIWNRGQLIRMALHRELIRRCARRADKIVFLSEWSRQAISPALGISLEKSTVIHYGVDDTFRRASTDREAPKGFAREGSGLKGSRRFILVVSSVQEHRNLRRLLEAYSNLVQSLGDPSYLSEPALSPPKGPVLSETKEQALALVIAGPIESVKLRRSLEQFLTARGLSSHVRFLDTVSSEELAILYRQAELLVFPSMAETFGVPLIEAMASGLPVVASNNSAFPEICDDAACYFDPFDVADMTRAMERVLTDPSLRRTLVKRGLERALAFSWDKAAKRVLTVMDTVAGRLE